MQGIFKRYYKTPPNVYWVVKKFNSFNILFFLQARLRKLWDVTQSSTYLSFTEKKKNKTLWQLLAKEKQL